MGAGIGKRSGRRGWISSIRSGPHRGPDPFFADPAYENENVEYVVGLELCRDLARAMKIGRGVERVSLDVPVSGAARATVTFPLCVKDFEEIEKVIRVYELRVIDPNRTLQMGSDESPAPDREGEGRWERQMLVSGTDLA